MIQTFETLGAELTAMAAVVSGPSSSNGTIPIGAFAFHISGTEDIQDTRIGCLEVQIY